MPRQSDRLVEHRSDAADSSPRGTGTFASEQAVESKRRENHRRVLDVAALLLFATVVAGMSWRLYQHWPSSTVSNSERWSLTDFRDVVYFPAHAVADGVNPYDTTTGVSDRYMQRYPVLDTLPVYSPLVMLIFSPLAMLPVNAAMVTFAILNLALCLWLARMTLRSVGRRASFAGVLGLSTLLLASQPGRGFFFAGQLSLPLALSTAGALWAADRRPWTGSALVAFSTFKPTFGLPLGLLLLARRDWRAGVGGLALGGALGLAGMLIVFGRSGPVSLEAIVDTLRGNQASFDEDPTVVPQTNKARVDLAATAEYLLARPLPPGAGLLIGVSVLGLSGAVLWRSRSSRDEQTAVSVPGAMLILSMFLCVYHNIYDLPLLILPIASCATGSDPSWRALTATQRWIVLCLLVTPFVNVLWTEGFQFMLERVGLGFAEDGTLARWLQRLSPAANGLSLAGVWAILAHRILVGRSALSCASRPASVTSLSKTASAT